MNLLCFHGSPGLPAEYELLQRNLPSVTMITEPRGGYPNHKPMSLESPEGNVYVGYSWGSVDTLRAAARDPGARGVILIAPYLFPRSGLNPLKKALLKTPVLGEAVLRKAGPGIVEELLVKTSYPEPVPADYRDYGKQLVDPAILKVAALEKEETPEGKPVADAIRADLVTLGKRGLPVAVIWGEQDQTSSEAEQIVPLRQKLNVELEEKLPRAGHALLWTHASALGRFVEGFLARISGKAPASVSR